MPRPADPAGDRGECPPAYLATRGLLNRWQLVVMSMQLGKGTALGSMCLQGNGPSGRDWGEVSAYQTLAKKTSVAQSQDTVFIRGCPGLRAAWNRPRG